MPKLTWTMPRLQREELKVLRKEYGERITKAQVGKIIGVKNYDLITAWLKDNRITVFRPFGRDLFSTVEVIEKFWSSAQS